MTIPSCSPFSELFLFLFPYFQGCVVFEGIDFTQISFFLFLQRHDWLADHFVECVPTKLKRSKDEIIAFLKSRLRPVFRVIVKHL